MWEVGCWIWEVLKRENLRKVFVGNKMEDRGLGSKIEDERNLYFGFMEGLCKRVEKEYGLKSEIDGGDDFMIFKIGKREAGNIRLEEGHIFISYHVPSSRFSLKN